LGDLCFGNGLEIKTGIQDADEPGIANVEVELLDDEWQISCQNYDEIPMENDQIDNLDNGGLSS